MVESVGGAPNEAALLALMERTGYHMIQENGQRKYGPPPDWNGPPPPRGCEIFVGKIPRDCYEDELVPAFERCGRIYEFRLMMDFSGSNRGYCFVTYTRREDARRAVSEMNNYEIRRGRFLGVCMSVDNCRLFVGGIPKHKQQEEILEEMKKVTEGVIDVIVYSSACDKTKNRGFAFVEYASHRAAAMARRKLIPGRIQLWGHQIAVDWAEPEQEVDEDKMSKVRVLYVRNLQLSTSEETLEIIFNHAAGQPGAVERVKKIRDYAFIHFHDRRDAEEAKNKVDKQIVDDARLEVTWAKPVEKGSYQRYTRGSGKLTPTALGQTEQQYGYPPGLIEPMQYLNIGKPPVPKAINRDVVNSDSMPNGNGPLSPAPIPSVMSTVMRGVPLRGRFSPPTLKTMSDGNGEGSLIRLPHPILSKVRANMECQFNNVDLAPPQYARQQQQCKLPVQILDELCAKKGWGSPAYQLNSTIGYDGSGDVQLFGFKVLIPFLGTVFTPPKLSASIDKAQNIAAEHVLQELRIPIEGGDAPVTAASVMMLCNGPAVSNSSGSVGSDVVGLQRANLPITLHSLPLSAEPPYFNSGHSTPPSFTSTPARTPCAPGLSFFPGSSKHAAQTAGLTAMPPIPAAGYRF